MLDSLIDKLAANPKIFIFLRRILENNFRGEKQVIRDHFKLSPGDQVLDLGCGTGEFSVFIPSQQYIGLDIEPAYIEYAKKNYAGKFILGDASKLDFPDRSFNKIMVIGVFHHMSDALSGKVLHEASRVLSDDGTFLFVEDLSSPENNFLTRWLHKLDKGEFIRTTEGYRNLVSPHFKIEKSFTMKSGLHPYQVFVLKKQTIA